jgi:hypothetical protein
MERWSYIRTEKKLFADHHESKKDKFEGCGDILNNIQAQRLICKKFEVNNKQSRVYSV